MADILLAILSKEVSTETVREKAKALLQVETLHFNLEGLKSTVEEDQPELKMRQNIFKVLFKFYGSDLLTTLHSGKHDNDVLESSIRYILDDNDISSRRQILHIAGEKLKTEINNTQCMVWGGLNYRGGRKGQVSLVCFHRGYLKTPPATFLGLPVLYRLYDKIEREPLEVCLSEKYCHTSLTDDTLEKTTELINAYGEKLFDKHTNLEALSSSSVISSKSKGLVETPSIVFYCNMKGVIPIGENPFPKELKIQDMVFPTDIREGFFTFGMQAGIQDEKPTHRIDKLRMGCSIGRENGGYSGTLGPFVHLNSGAIGFITCAHVVGLDRTVINANVVQPGDGDSVLALRAVGRILDVQFDPKRTVGIDAALIQVDRRRRDVEPNEFIWLYPRQIEEADLSPENPPSFRGGRVKTSITFRDVKDKIVIKCGKVTGLTKGFLAVKGTMIKVLTKPHPIRLPKGMTWNGSERVVMKGQYLVENMTSSFFTVGDSGAGVYLVEEDGGNLSLIGLAIGLLNDYTVVTPIGPVLDSLQLNPSNMQFPEPMESP